MYIANFTGSFGTMSRYLVFIVDVMTNTVFLVSIIFKDFFYIRSVNSLALLFAISYMRIFLDIITSLLMTKQVEAW